MFSEKLTRGLSLFDCPYYKLPVEKQLEYLAEYCPQSRMNEINSILSTLTGVTIVTVNDFMLCVTHENGASYSSFRLTIVDELE